MSSVGRALVTGAGRRLGLAIARDLGARGYDVAFHYHGSAEGALAGVAEIEGAGGRAAALQADLLDESEVAALVEQATQALGGPLTVLVNNASIFENDLISDMTRESWDRAMESNLRAAVKLTQDFAAQAPRAATDEKGEPVARATVINMIDQRVLKPTPFFLSYSVAKSGLFAFTRTAAQALAPHIRVNAIGPGPTLVGDRQSPEHFAQQRAACVLGRGSDPEDILAAVRFILDCKALTGQMLAIDGGQHLIWQTPDIAGIAE